MDILFLLIPIALGFLVIALALFFWAIRNGQYDDMDSQSLKIIMDERRSKQATQEKNKDDSDNDNSDKGNSDKNKGNIATDDT